MIFTQLTLTNFGIYKGKQSIDFRLNSSGDNYQPIILVGGKNGSGKTTLFEAIKLCLYGRETLGFRVDKAEYERYLTKRIHRQADSIANSTQASVRLEFEQAHSGELKNYIVERNWHKTDNSVQESLLLQENGRYIFITDDELRQEFIKDLLPPGLAQLFFIDGEKIQNLAEEETGKTALAEAIKATFGLNLVENLKSDLAVYIRREQEQSGNRELLKKREEAERLIATLTEKFLNAQTLEQEAEKNFHSTERELDKVLEILKREGKLLADNRVTAEARKTELEAQLEQTKKRIRGPLAESLLPFALIPDLCQALGEQLHKEEQYLHWHSAQTILQENSHQLLQTLGNLGFWQDISEVPTEAVPKIASKIEQELISFTKTPSQFEGFNLRHDLSETDRRQLLNVLDNSLDQTLREARIEFYALKMLEQKIQEAEAQIRLAPSEDVLKPLSDKHLKLREEKGAREQEYKRLKDNRESAFREREIAQKTLEVIEQDIRRDKGFQERVGLAGRTQRVIERYYNQLLEDRITELEVTLVRYFNRLSRKRNFVWKASIDQQSFGVTLFTRDGKQLPKSSLSAGEKQLYAISLLWALRDISGRPLPVVIDTPLGRLDSDHRGHIVKSYFPYASHQVLLLSTDTEITETYLAELGPAISHSYRLEYDNEEASTFIKDGYFWDTSVFVDEADFDEDFDATDEFTEQELALDEA